MKKIIIVLVLLIPALVWGQSHDISKNSTTTQESVLAIRNGIPVYASTLINADNTTVYDADYYVATWGSDVNAGTFASPWLTWDKAFETVVAGDTVYIRGGRYSGPTSDPGAGISNKDGTQSNPIKIFAYPGEIPIMDMSTCTYVDGSNYGIYINGCDYWHLKGLYITNTPHGTIAQPYGIYVHESTGVIIENCVSYNNEGNGITLDDTNNSLILNCDAYGNIDAVGETNGNGITIVYTDLGSNNKIKGCRSWGNYNGEGFDLWDCEGTIEIDSCWAWSNQGGSGDGYGFELGKTVNTLTDTTRIITNCMSAYNSYGFGQAAADVIMELYNNIAYKNNINFVFAGANPDNPNIFKNNIDYDPIDDISYFNASAIHNHNTWDHPVTVTDADFISLDTAQLAKPRKAQFYDDGSVKYLLPDMDFGKLAETSDLIEAGINVGLSYYGNRPDLGAWEANKTLQVIREAYTATADGTGTGIIHPMTQNITVTSANANYICCLPEASASTVGTIITGTVGANGFELRVQAAQAATVYINNVTTNVEAAIPASTNFRVTQIDATHWILEATTNLGAVVTAIVPDAI